MCCRTKFTLRKSVENLENRWNFTETPSNTLQHYFLQNFARSVFQFCSQINDEGSEHDL